MSYSLDIWCFGNILYELATGTVLFQGNNLNEQLKMYIEMFGRLPKKMVSNADAYFYNGDPAKFLWLQVDAVTGRSLTSIVDMSREPHLSLKEKLFDFFPDAKGEERKSVVQLHDLIEKCLALNPRKRISTEEALNHPFWLPPKKEKKKKKKN
jgi:serine/threonine-protein kinase PRP4